MVYVYRPTVHLRYVSSFLYEYMDMDMDTTEGIHKLGTVLRFSAKQ